MERRFTALVTLCFAAFLFCCVPNARAQGEQNLYFAGASADTNGHVSGSALWAHSVNSVGTYAFTAVDFIPASVKPFTVTTNVAVGISQKIATIDGVSFYAPTSAGISFTGTNTGLAWSTGIGAPIKLHTDKRGFNWYAMPTVRWGQSTAVSGGITPIFGILFGGGSPAS